MLRQHLPVLAMLCSLPAMLYTPGNTMAQEAPAVGEAAQTPSANLPVAFIDVAAVVNGHKPLIEALAELKGEVNRVDAEVKSQQQELRTWQQQLAGLGRGTPEFVDLEARITRKQADLAATVQTRKTAFVRQEAKLYWNVYRQIEREAQRYAREQGLAMIVRVGTPPTDLVDPKAILNQMNRDLVWYDPKRDITRVIAERMSQPAEPEETAPEDANGESSPEDAEPASDPTEPAAPSPEPSPPGSVSMSNQRGR